MITAYELRYRVIGNLKKLGEFLIGDPAIDTLECPAGFHEFYFKGLSARSCFESAIIKEKAKVEFFLDFAGPDSTILRFLGISGEKPSPSQLMGAGDFALLGHYYNSRWATSTNPTKVTVNKSKVAVNVGETSEIKASVQKKGKKKLLKHDVTLRYISTNDNVATVSSNGTITAVDSGTCKIYCIAGNGVKKTVTVTVPETTPIPVPV